MTVRTRLSVRLLTSRNLDSFHVGLYLRETRMKACTCKSRKCLRALSVLRSCQLCTVVDTESNIWIGRSTTNLASIDAACAMNNDFDDTNRRVYWSPGKKLFEIEGKYVR